jgi:hypothetical protein
MEDEKIDEITEVLCNKSVLKQDVFTNVNLKFAEFKTVAKELVNAIKEKVCSKDERIKLKYVDKSQYEFHIIIAGDILVFNQHSNVFKFDENHFIWKTDYLAKTPERGYCGIINIYNFLADSFKYNRVNDSGYLIGRLFVNSENHFIGEGKRTLGFLYTDFVNQTLEKEEMKEIVENLILHTLEFDLYVPPYEKVSEVSVYEVKTTGDSIQLKTGKRMGFQFSNKLQEKK